MSPDIYTDSDEVSGSESEDEATDDEVSYDDEEYDDEEDDEESVHDSEGEDDLVSESYSGTEDSEADYEVQT